MACRVEAAHGATEKASEGVCVFLYIVQMSARRSSARLRGEEALDSSGAFHFRGLLDAVPQTPPGVPTTLTTPAGLDDDCLQLVAEGVQATHATPARARNARSPPRRQGGDKAPSTPDDCGPKPDDIPGYVWSCEPNSDGVWQWTRVKAGTSQTAKAVTDLVKAYDFGTKAGRMRWQITFVAALAADVRFNQGRMLTGLLMMLPVPVPAWVIQMMVGVLVRVVNMYSSL